MCFLPSLNILKKGYKTRQQAADSRTLFSCMLCCCETSDSWRHVGCKVVDEEVLARSRHFIWICTSFAPQLTNDRRRRMDYLLVRACIPRRGAKFIHVWKFLTDERMRAFETTFSSLVCNGVSVEASLLFEHFGYSPRGAVR